MIQYLIGFLIGIGFVVVIDQVMIKCNGDEEKN